LKLSLRIARGKINEAVDIAQNTRNHKFF